MVLEDPTQALKAQFSLNARGRPASISMVSSNITAAAPVFITAAGDDDAIFWTGADGFFYTTSGDLSRITNTGLDISSLGTHKLDFHAIQNKVFAVSSGAVYSWNLDGSDFGLEFDTGHGDITAIHINSLGNSASLTTHNAGPVNNRYKIYNLATGAETYDLHFFKGLTSYNLTSGQWAHDQGRTYFSRTSAIIYVEPATNIIDGLGSLSHLACQDICIDEIGNIAYHLCSPGVYYQSTETVGTDTLLTGTPVAQTQIDLYESGGVKWIIGNNFRVQTNGSNYTTDWASGSGTSVNQLCTRRPF